MDIKSMNYEELEAYVVNELGEKKFRAKQLYDWIHKKHVRTIDEMSNISSNLKDQLKNADFRTLEVVKKLVSEIDGTTKYLFKLNDGSIIESVLMRYKHGNSVCISSQVGCRMGCNFCASTVDGLERNLLASELLDQIYAIESDTKERVSNIVLMGSGEPFDNYDEVVKFIQLITDQYGLNISQRNITVSTCGIVPKIKALADQQLQITLAISLHATTDEKRKALMPIANKYSIQEVLEACKYYFEKTRRRITFEYSLVDGVNDNSKDAMALGQLLKTLNCHINLIPINPIEERDYRQSTKINVLEFKKNLEKYKENVTIRREMGRDIKAACGQLRKSYIDKEL